MDDSKIRQIVRDEIRNQNSKSRFNLGGVQRHVHNGLDAPKINQSNVVPGLRAEGAVTFAAAAVYKLGLTFNPTSVLIHGNVFNTGGGGERFIIVGNAQFGPSFYFQPGTSRSTVLGGPQQNIIQSTTYFGVDVGGILHTLVDEGHIVDVFYGGHIYARATIIGFDSSAIYVQVDNLETGWEINLSWTVT